MKHLEVDLSQGVAEALPAWVVVQLLPCYFLEPGEFQSYQNPTKQKEEEEEEERLKQTIYQLGRKKNRVSFSPQTKM